nr:hypothetical protein [Tanacetum cinerariifolium]
MMSLATLSLSVWDYALESAEHILNMVPTKKVDKTPYELWHEKGYPKETMAYYFYYPPKNKIVVERYADFLEKDFILQNESGRIIELEDEDILPSENTSEHPIKEEKMQSMYDNKEWRLVILPPNAKVVKSKWMYKKKTNMDGKETFSPVANVRAIRILIAIAAYHDYEIWKMDVKTVFLNGFLEEEIYMEQPEELKCMQNVPYASAVGSIMYDVRNTKDTFLVYGADPEAELQVNCYYDAGFETDRDDMKSQTRYIFVLNGGAVEWKRFKQSTTAQHVTEAEYIAASEAVLIRKFIDKLGVVPSNDYPIKINCDNSAAIIMAKEL